MKPRSAEKKREICDFVNEFRSSSGRVPSLQVIADAFGVNRSTVLRYLREMDEDGLVSYSAKDIQTRRFNSVNTKTTQARVVGSIPCGEAQYEEEYVDEFINLPESLFGKGEYYILHASGDSMVDAGIADGDLVVVDAKAEAKVGNVVVALTDRGESTMKCFEGFDENGKVILAYRNEMSYPGKVILADSMAVQGIAKYVIKAL